MKIESQPKNKNEKKNPIFLELERKIIDFSREKKIGEKFILDLWKLFKKN
jgi:hypothetical protein